MFNYEYALGATIAKPNCDYNFLYRDEKINVKRIIKDAIKKFNELSKDAKNPKQIVEDRVTISKSEIRCILKSKNELAAPGRGMRVLSQTLAEHEYFKDKIYNHGLLKFYCLDTNEIKLNEKDLINPDMISDEVFITSLMRYLLKAKGGYTPENYKQQKALEQMKLIAYNCNMIEKLEEWN